MPSLLRLFRDQQLGVGEIIPLPSDQAHYVRQVMRRKAGDQVELFNGRDGGFLGGVIEASKRVVTISLKEQIRPPANDFPLTLCFAVVKRGPVEMMVQKATELGVTALQPMVTARTTAKNLNPERLTAIAIEAAEQCERVSVPALADPSALEALLAKSEGPLIFADEAGDDPNEQWGGPAGHALPLLEALRGFSAPSSTSLACATLFIGPEGGFSPEERAVLRDHARVVPVRLGPRILRADTAAIAALALIQAAIGDWRRGQG